ncbi:hypothetical protein HanRHA438_Chr02g0082471 [Helianthus annuus]|nr:hypothetical protein HanRHA438_Chr02g0082471 [Helianthus annuus]KAJ0952153.1 hypothetical protein HanPSC8_Chr02g0068791 [Helianthus annuus]
MILIIYIAHVSRAELHSFGTLIRPVRCDFRYQTHNQIRFACATCGCYLVDLDLYHKRYLFEHGSRMGNNSCGLLLCFA